MNVACADLEAALRGEDPDLVDAFARHVEGCPACQAEVDVWNAIGAAAPSLRKDWPSPGLEARIRAELRERPRSVWWRRPRFTLPLAAAACLLLAVVVGVAPHRSPVRPSPASTPFVEESAADPLLTEKALADVEKAQQAYIAAIDALTRVAAARLEESPSPAMAAYREKLLVLDSAIAECRAEVQRNRFNAHLRLELLSVYQEKQRTLESLLKEDPHAS